VLYFRYSKKRKTDRYISFDPRPASAKDDTATTTAGASAATAVNPRPASAKGATAATAAQTPVAAAAAGPADQEDQTGVAGSGQDDQGQVDLAAGSQAPSIVVLSRPRPEEAAAVNLLRAAESLPGTSMWEMILQYPYENYDLDLSRKCVLRSLCIQLETELVGSLSQYESSTMTTASGVHVDGTEAQAASPLWHKMRHLRVTGSRFKNFCLNPMKMAKDLWKEHSDLSFVKSIQWGQENEDVARQEYEDKSDCLVTTCGIFVSKENPVFAASPDGLIQGGLIEIKCPFSLREEDLFNLSDSAKLLFQYRDTNGNLHLKRSHSYFYQIQLGMFVTGYPFTDFIT
jgi:hypothetical protein